MKKTDIQPHKSSLGMNANLASLVIFAAMIVVSWIPYLKWVAWGVPLVFFFMEKSSGFVKFQAVTALILGIISAAFSLILQIFIWILTPKNIYSAVNLALGRGWGAWVLLGTLSTIIAVILTIIEIYMIWKAYAYKQVELPIIGPAARKASEKLSNMDFR